MTFSVLMLYAFDDSDIIFWGNGEVSGRDYLECRWNPGMVGKFLIYGN